MTEIELKAHVADPVETEKRIRAFASFRSETVKKDCYWTAGGGSEPTLQPVSAQAPRQADRAASVQPDIVAEHASDKMTVTAAATVAGTMAVAIVAAGLAVAGAGKIVIIGLCLGTALLSAIASIVTGMRSRPPVRSTRTEPTREEAPRRLKVRLREEVAGDETPAQTIVTYKRKELAGNIEVNDEKEFSIDNREDFEALLGDLGFRLEIRKEKATKTFDWTAPDGTAVGIELSLVGDLGWFVEIEILAESPGDAEIARAQGHVRSALTRCGIPESAVETRFYTDMIAELTRAD